ncbi:hypothetical protein [Pseudoclavibacter helvolus]|uniref:Uncharacterized protein n=1 Tax=Pseudoclavibacter helvolus TaxID=255205 RepID=A0A7W4UM81_9MICO|nr:hypothetical protein [Pseudoclavibacter helvolus]MBB2956963.1 hypothetical protein [Pseudoclavibacter helvolus]
MNPIDITWHHDIVSTLTGELIQTVHPSSWNWRTVLNGVGDGSHSFHLRDAKTKLDPATWQNLLGKVNRTVVTSYSIDGGPKIAKYAGILINERWSRTTGVSAVTSKEFRYLADLRYFMMTNNYEVSPHVYEAGYSKGGLLTRLWQILFRRPELEGSPNAFNLPIRLPPATGGTEVADYKKWTLTTGEEATAALQDSFNGPDIYIEPMWDTETGNFYWQAKWGNPEFPELPFDVQVSARQHPLHELSFTEDGSKVVTGIFGVGKGSDEDMRLGFGIYDPTWPSRDGMPVIDATESFKNESDPAKLNSLSMAALRARRFPIRQYESGLRAAAPVGAGVYGVDVKPGWKMPFEDAGDERFPASTSMQYVIGVGHNSTSKHFLTVDYQSR